MSNHLDSFYLFTVLVLGHGVNKDQVRLNSVSSGKVSACSFADAAIKHPLRAWMQHATWHKALSAGREMRAPKGTRYYAMAWIAWIAETDRGIQT